MSNEQDVQEKRLNAMKYKILKAEQENLKTREKTTDQMVETIRRIIMDEAKKKHIRLNIRELEKRLGVSVVPTSARSEKELLR